MGWRGWIGARDGWGAAAPPCRRSAEGRDGDCTSAELYCPPNPAPPAPPTHIGSRSTALTHGMATTSAGGTASQTRCERGVGVCVQGELAWCGVWTGVDGGCMRWCDCFSKVCVCVCVRVGVGICRDVYRCLGICSSLPLSRHTPPQRCAGRLDSSRLSHSPPTIQPLSSPPTLLIHPPTDSTTPTPQHYIHTQPTALHPPNSASSTPPHTSHPPPDSTTSPASWRPRASRARASAESTAWLRWTGARAGPTPSPTSEYRGFCSQLGHPRAVC